MSSLKEKLAYKVLNGHQNKTKREYKLLNQITKVGVIYNIDDLDAGSYKTIKGYFERKGIQVSMLGFLNRKEVDESIDSNLNDELITLKQTNWLGIPKKEHVNNILPSGLDYLINLDAGPIVALQAICAHSDALCRLGRYYEEYPNNNDMMVSTILESPIGVFNEIKKTIFKDNG